MNTKRLVLLVGLALFVMTGFHLGPQGAVIPGLVAEAEAIIGAPRTPLSVAGVARRTAVRSTAYAASSASASAAASQQQAATAQQQAEAAEAEAAAAKEEAAQAKQAAQASVLPVGTTVSALPSGCTTVGISGVNYFNCGGTYYRAAFQSNNVVYVVSQP